MKCFPTIETCRRRLDSHLCMMMVLIFLCGSVTVTSFTDCKPSEIYYYPLVLNCEEAIAKDGPQVPPSPHCCFYVKIIKPICMCQEIYSVGYGLWSLKKWTYVAKTCNNPLKPGTKCGSKFFVYLSFILLLCCTMPCDQVFP